ncbi:hypothetical protein ABFS82_10G077000, partial [Erythranthe guttata]
ITKTSESFDIFESIKNEEFEEEVYRKQTRKRLVIISVSSILLVLLILGAIIGILIPIHEKNNPVNEKYDPMIKTICNSTLYKDSCYSSIYSLKTSSSNKNPPPDSDTPKSVFMLSLQVTFNELVRVKSSILNRLIYFAINDSITHNALKVCDHVIKDAISQVNMSMSSLQSIERFSDNSVISDLMTCLSTAITDQTTCLDGLTEYKENIPPSILEETRALMENATVFTSNSLAIISNMFKIVRGFQISVNDHRRLLRVEEVRLRPNLTVAKDGSGDYRTITEAVKAMPRRSENRFFIYVKKGKYEENVFVDSDSWNLMIYGDGMKKTIVSSSLNYMDGVATFNSGTFITEGRGFIARDMGFKNKAGPAKLQAVALRSSSDRTIFHRCHFDGYQDTLYTHSNRQYYRDCTITGTIDFIFGNAAAVFQNCTIQPRQPGPGQYNTITAQSKSDPNQKTGFSIQRCRISPFGNLTAATFLGRPWNNHSTVVVMETDVQGIIDPAGWIKWAPDSEVPDTIFYAEYNNTGPGSVISRRVKWPGYRPDITEEEAEKFHVDPFIQGYKWIIEAGIEYDSRL